MLYDIQSALPYIAVGVIVGALYLRIRGCWPAARVLFFVAFVAYLTVVASYVLFPIIVDDALATTARQGPHWLSQINLVPLSGLPPVGSFQVVGNVVLGIPFGLGMPFVLGRPGWRVVGLGLAFALGIEIAQLVMNVSYGFMYRFVDINDALLNFLGVLIGLTAFHALSRAYVALLPKREQGSYIDTVLAGTRSAGPEFA